jgi:hypothetical protein
LEWRLFICLLALFAFESIPSLEAVIVQLSLDLSEMKAKCVSQSLKSEIRCRKIASVCLSAHDQVVWTRLDRSPRSPKTGLPSSASSISLHPASYQIPRLLNFRKPTFPPFYIPVQHAVLALSSLHCPLHLLLLHLSEAVRQARLVCSSFERTAISIGIGMAIGDERTSHCFAWIGAVKSVRGDFIDVD